MGQRRPESLYGFFQSNGTIHHYWYELLPYIVFRIGPRMSCRQNPMDYLLKRIVEAPWLKVWFVSGILLQYYEVV